jgi:Rrf2 family protein
MLSNTCKYAIRAVIYLSVNEKKGVKIGSKQISKDLEIPLPFLGKIMQQLAKNKILASTKGPHGGFSLSKPAESIFLIEIVNLFDGSEVFDSCLLGLSLCDADPGKKEICPMHPVSEPLLRIWGRLRI